MPGPLSAPQGHRRDPAGPKDGPHGRCQGRESCTGPGCRVSTGKTRGATAPDHHNPNGDTL